MAKYTEGQILYTTQSLAMDGLFQALRAHLTNNGWTEADVISNTVGARSIVFKGAALDATADIRPWIQIVQSATSTITFTGYADYDTGTHTGIAACGGAGVATLTPTDTQYAYAFWFDGFGGFMSFKSNLPGQPAWERTYLGFTLRALESDEMGITKTTGTVSIGATSINVASDMTGKLRVGQKIQIMNYAHSSASANAAHCETVTISSIASGSIGVSATTLAYDTGAVLGDNFCSTVIFSPGVTAGTPGTSTGFCPYNLDGTRTSNSGQATTTQTFTFAPRAQVGPDLYNRFGTGLIALTAATAAKLGWKGFCRGGIAIAGTNGGGVMEDLYSSGTYSYLSLDGGQGNNTMLALGPREI